ncbi:MFS transporter, partial [Pseudomonas sp. IPO3749]|nr:MFS transporter [Pseudomonas sp. IPO3749]
VVLGGGGDGLGVSLAVMVLAGVLLLTLPLAWVVRRGMIDE